jgi:hypothetical protein
MVRTLISTAAAVAMMSGLAIAQTLPDSSTTTITRSPAGISKSTTAKHLDAYGNVVNESKTFKGGPSGSSMTRTHTGTDPETGTTVTHSTTINR